MTKKDLFEQLKEIEDDCEIDIYDLRDFSHPTFKLNLDSYFDYDNGRPIVTIELD